MKFRQYINENGAVINAHVVTEATEGNVVTVNGPRQVLAGDVVVEAQNGYYSEVHEDPTEFSQLYREVTQEDLDAEDEAEVERVTVGVEKGFDPDKRTAKDVNKYLSQVKSREEFERVVEAEQNGRNRASAIPERNWDEE